MRILYVTTIGSTMSFFSSLIKELVDQGNTVDIATNEEERPVPEIYDELGCKVFPLSWSRSPLSKGNLKAIKEINKIVRESKYDIVHCHTPIAAACTRIGCRSLRKSGTRVIYTAHGFHFYKGAPLLNWLVYYPIEWICAHWTDTLITINHEDFERAKKHMHAKEVKYVPGVGIDVDKFRNTAVNRAEKRREIGVPEDCYLLLSVGELNKNKNHQVVIKALAELKKAGELEEKNIHYAIAGQGELHNYLLELAKKLNVADRVHLLGYRNDVAELYKAADLYVHPSLREGLPVALMEAVCSGVKCIASNCRGNADIMLNDVSFLFSNNSTSELKRQIGRIGKIERIEQRCGMKKFNYQSVKSDIFKVYYRQI